MKLSVVSLIKLGHKYMSLWPQHAELAMYFGEYRPVQVTRMLYRIMPGLAVLTLALPYAMNAHELLNHMLVYALFMASMPVQAFLLLGVKADKFLPPSLAKWYREGIERFQQQGGEIDLTLAKPRYIDLAKLLNMTFEKKR